MFLKSAEKLKEIVEVCKENRIEAKGNVFKKSAEEIKQIVEVCKENRIEAKGNVFLKSAEEIKQIVEVCKENKIEITGSVFLKSAEKLKQNIMYIKENYGSQYVNSLIVSKNYENLVSVLPYLKEKGCLDVVKNSASILSLKLDEIKEREHFIENIGENFVVEDKKGKKQFNSIFGLSKKNYQKRIEKENLKTGKTSKSLIRAVAKDETPKLADEADEFLNLLDKEKANDEKEYE